MSEESLENLTTLDNTFVPILINYCILPDLKFNGHCLINDDVFIPREKINLYISYTLDPCLRDLNTDFTLNNCFFWSLNLTKNTDPEKHKYSS